MMNDWTFEAARGSVTRSALEGSCCNLSQRILRCCGSQTRAPQSMLTDSQ